MCIFFLHKINSWSYLSKLNQGLKWVSTFSLHKSLDKRSIWSWNLTFKMFWFDVVYISLIVSCRKGKTHNGPGEERKHRLMGMVSILKSLLFCCLLFPFSHWVSFTNNCTQFCTAISQTYLHPLSYLLVYTHTIYPISVQFGVSWCFWKKCLLFSTRPLVLIYLNPHFQQPLLQSPVPHDPSKIILTCWFGALENFLLSMGKTAKYFYFSGFFE